MEYSEQTVRLLNEVAKNAEMGKHTAQDLASITKDTPMRQALLRQVQDYEDLQNRARAMLAAGGQEAEEENMMTKMSAKMGVKMQTALDDSNHNLAEMVIKGSHMGQRDMRKAMKENPSVNVGAHALAERLYEMEGHWAAQMEKFL